jgi:hypothetical protein
MKKLLLFVALIYGGYQGWGKYSASKAQVPLFTAPYVAVYGRNSCGFTQQMLKNVKASNLQYYFFDVDDQAVSTSLHSRMTAAHISTQMYNLPVVDVNGVLSIRPEFNDVLAKYKLVGALSSH